MNVSGITSTVPWTVPVSQGGNEAVMFALQHDGGSVIIGDDDADDLLSYEREAIRRQTEADTAARRIAENRSRFFHR